MLVVYVDPPTKMSFDILAPPPTVRLPPLLADSEFSVQVIAIPPNEMSAPVLAV